MSSEGQENYERRNSTQTDTFREGGVIEDVRGFIKWYQVKIAHKKKADSKSHGAYEKLTKAVNAHDSGDGLGDLKIKQSYFVAILFPTSSQQHYKKIFINRIYSFLRHVYNKAGDSKRSLIQEPNQVKKPGEIAYALEIFKQIEDCLRSKNADRAYQLYELGKSAANANANLDCQAILDVALANIEFNIHEAYGDAVKIVLSSMENCLEVGSVFVMDCAYNILMVSFSNLDKNKLAKKYGELYVELARATGLGYYTGAICLKYGRILFEMGEIGQANTLFDEALTLADELCLSSEVTTVWVGWGIAATASLGKARVHVYQGNLDKAKAYAEKSIEYFKKMDSNERPIDKEESEAEILIIYINAALFEKSKTVPSSNFAEHEAKINALTDTNQSALRMKFRAYLAEAKSALNIGDHTKVWELTQQILTVMKACRFEVEYAELFEKCGDNLIKIGKNKEAADDVFSYLVDRSHEIDHEKTFLLGLLGLNRAGMEIHIDHNELLSVVACYLRTCTDDLSAHSQIEILETAGDVYEFAKAYDLALNNYQRVILLCKHTLEVDREVNVNIKVGTIHMRMGDALGCIKYYEHSCDLAKGISDHKLSILAHLKCAAVWGLLKDRLKAIPYFKYAEYLINRYSIDEYHTSYEYLKERLIVLDSDSSD